MSKIIGYKTVDTDMFSWHENKTTGEKLKYELNKQFIVKGRKGGPCGVGLHFSPSACNAIGFAQDYYRLFICESDTKYLLGKDEEKYRVSHLTLTKEIDVAKREAEINKKVNKLSDLNKYFLKPNVPPSKQKIVAAINAWVKQARLEGSYSFAPPSKVKIHITDNLFETLFYLNEGAIDWLSISINFDTSLHLPIKDFDNSDLRNAFFHVVNAAEACIHYGEKYNVNGLIDLIMMGALPIRLDQDKVLVYAPTVSPYKQKFLLKIK